MFVLPELRRRIEDGSLAPEFIKNHPTKDEPGHVVFPGITLVVLEETKPVQVLIDGEAGVEILSRVKLPAELGDELRWNDLEIAGFRLPSLPPNSGYILLLNQNGHIGLSFDFRYNAGFAKEHFVMGEAFLALAKDALQKGHPRVCFENLFHATEKLSKAILLTMPSGLRGSTDDQPMAFKTHKQVRELYRRLGDDGDGQALLADLAKDRNSATYFTGKFERTVAELQSLIHRAESLRDRTQKWVPDRESNPPERRWELPPPNEAD